MATEEYRLYLMDGATEKYCFKFDSKKMVPELAPSIEPFYTVMPARQAATPSGSIAADKGRGRVRLSHYVEKWEMKGLIFDDTPAEVWTAFDNLKAALFSQTSGSSVNYNNISKWAFILKSYDGVDETEIARLDGASDTAINGLQISDFKVTDSPGRWCNNFTFDLTVSVDTLANDTLHPTGVSRTHELSNSGGTATHRWTITASGPGAKAYICSVAGNSILPNNAPWQELKDIGYDLPLPAKLALLSLTENYDGDSWTGTFEQKAAGSGNKVDGKKKIKGVLSALETLTVTGGYKKVVSLSTISGPPLMGYSPEGVLELNVTATARCEDSIAANNMLLHWLDNWPMKQFEGGGLTDYSTSPPKPSGEYDEKGDPTEYNVGMTRKYIFDSLGSLFAALGYIITSTDIPNLEPGKVGVLPKNFGFA